MDNEIIIDHFQRAKQKYPKLLPPKAEGNLWIISGAIDVIDGEGGYWDTYDIQIVLPTDFPVNLPILIETGNKIERHVNWHISTKGVCCLSTQAKMYHELEGKITLLNWLDKFAHPYLANHVYKVREGHYANEGFSHGIQGIIEGWKSILHLNEAIQIVEYLRLMVGIKTLSLNQKCFCGSGKKYKRCFLLQLKNHQLNIPANKIFDDIKIITGKNK